MHSFSWYSRGKLLITSEYLVLHGATALAFPLKTGQWLTVRDSDSPGILSWSAHTGEGLPWFTASFALPDLDILQSNNVSVATRLQYLLLKARMLNPGFLIDSRGVEAESRVEFDLSWGLGSSSTLVSNLAYWAGVDEFDLHFLANEGSGYDIACARADGPILYRLEGKKPVVERVTFPAAFRSSILYVYSGRKQDSAKSVASYRADMPRGGTEVRLVSGLTTRFLEAGNLNELMTLVREHEELIGDILNEQPLKERLFGDFTGEVKSLGAWGGDFFMAVSPLPLSETRAYFRDRGFHLFREHDEFVL